jgi:hypothetical protein
MLEQENLEAISRAAGITVEEMHDIINSPINVMSSEDEYILLAERLSEFIEEPDKAAGFVLVGNDTWLPKHLVNTRKRQQRKVSRMPENGIVWTR